MTHHEELSLINLHDPLMKCPVGPRDKLNILRLQLQKTHWHKSREDADLQWQAPIPKAAWPFDHATNVKFIFPLSQDILPINLAGC